MKTYEVFWVNFTHPYFWQNNRWFFVPLSKYLNWWFAQNFHWFFNLMEFFPRVNHRKWHIKISCVQNYLFPNKLSKMEYRFVHTIAHLKKQFFAKLQQQRAYTEISNMNENCVAFLSKRFLFCVYMMLIRNLRYAILFPHTHIFV